eukprot:jgi/Tetstr1/439247/TSEL_027689.t1
MCGCAISVPCQHDCVSPLTAITAAAAVGSGWKMSIEKRIRKNEVPVYELMRMSAADLELLAETDALVGTGSASFFKLALQLSAARKQAVPPFISLDSAYCDSWRMCCDVRPDGAAVTC